MENQIEIVNQNAEVVEAKPNYNKKTGDVVIPMSIKCKKVKTDKNTFNAVSGLMYLEVIKDGVNLGLKNRWLNVHFTKEAFKTVDEACDVKSVDDLSTGTLYVKAKNIQAPSRYEVKVDDETGELIYPEIWVRGGIMGFEPYVVNASSFEYHKTEKIEEAQFESKESTFDVNDEN